MTKVLIMGFGSIGKKHAQVLLSEALKDLVGNNIEIFTFKSSEDLTPAFFHEMSFCIISNPTYVHAKSIEYILNNCNKPLFIEKPAFSNLPKHDNLEGKIIKEITERNILSYVACNLRFHPCISFLKKYLTSKKEQNAKLDEVNVYCGSYLPDWRKNINFRDSYSSKPEEGGGVHLDLFHELDYIQYLLGKPKAKNKTLRNSSHLRIKAIDYANYTLEYDEFTANIILNYYRKQPKRSLELVFEDEIIYIDLLNCSIERTKSDENKNNKIHKENIFQMTNFDIYETYVAQMRYFIECINNAKQPMNSLLESIEVLETCLA